MLSIARLAGALLLGLALAQFATADEHTHTYSEGGEVVLWMSVVGPYHNRQETYAYFSLPYCRGPKSSISHDHETIGEAILGVELEYSGLDILFNRKTPEREYCSVTLTENKYKAFAYAVRNHYWYQMYIDDLPIWGNVGDYGEQLGMEGHKDVVDPSAPMYIFTHRRFDIGINGNQIVDVSMVSERRAALTSGTKISFTYEVNWIQSRIPFKLRFEKYLDPSFFQHKIHWFSIFNSFMMVIFLVGLVTMILMRTLRKDCARYGSDEDLEDLERDLTDEYGWKQIHGDVFRAPPMRTLLAAIVGAGSQLALVALCVILLAIAGDLYEGRGSLLTTAIFAYAATAPVAGFISGSLYARMGGTEWIKQMVLTASLMPCLAASFSFLVNLIAMYYHATRAIPFTTLLSITAICLFIILPLTLVGTVLGRNINGVAEFPCRVNAVPRPIPDKRWYTELSIVILLGGLLPFGSIFIEMYFIFTSFWAYKIYYVFGFTLLVFLILMVVSICVTIVSTYFILNAEDHRWHWAAFLSSASTALYVYLYAIYYFLWRTKMYGMFQTTFYFSNMALLCATLGIMCGAIGFHGASYFVQTIYRNVKID